MRRARGGGGPWGTCLQVLEYRAKTIGAKDRVKAIPVDELACRVCPNVPGNVLFRFDAHASGAGIHKEPPEACYLVPKRLENLRSQIGIELQSV